MSCSSGAAGDQSIRAHDGLRPICAPSKMVQFMPIRHSPVSQAYRRYRPTVTQSRFRRVLIRQMDHGAILNISVGAHPDIVDIPLKPRDTTHQNDHRSGHLHHHSRKGPIHPLPYRRLFSKIGRVGIGSAGLRMADFWVLSAKSGETRKPAGRFQSRRLPTCYIVFSSSCAAKKLPHIK